MSENFKEFIDSDFKTMSVRKLKKKLKDIWNQQMESIKVQSSSTKMLNFLVNDMLDFAQMRSGKFRKNNNNFDLKEAINEIVSIQMMKAEFCGIQLSF